MVNGENTQINKTKNILKNNWKKTWQAILITEFLGTIALVLWIILPSSMGFNEPEAHANAINFWTAWAKIWELMFMKALWVAGFIVGLVYLLRSISVNLNPIVTIAEMAKGNDTVQLGIYKISVQLLGGLIAGYIGFGIANAMGLWDPADNTLAYHSSLDAVSPRLMTYNWGGFEYLTNSYNVTTINEMAVPGLFVIFSLFLEFLFSFGLLASIFYFDMHKNIRPLFIGVVIWIMVSIGIRTDNIALNPARLMGPAIANSTMDFSYGFDSEGYEIWMMFYLIPELMAAALFYSLESFKKINN